MRIISVTTEYPGPGNPRGGLFVQRRLAALSRIEDVHVIHLEPWFPLLRPRARPTTQNGYPDHPPAVRPGMFYLPGVLKGLDSYWVKKAVVPAIRALEGEGQADLIDAHFGYPEGVGCVKAALKLRLPAFITMRGLERPVLRYRWRGSQLLWALRRGPGNPWDRPGHPPARLRGHARSRQGAASVAASALPSANLALRPAVGAGRRASP